jgi:hypothetical protein
MDETFTVMKMQRSSDLPNWHFHDAAVLADFTSNGGVGIPGDDSKDVMMPPKSSKEP